MQLHVIDMMGLRGTAVLCRNTAAASDGAGNGVRALQQLLGLAGLLQTAVSGAEAKAAELSAIMPEEARYHSTAGPSWLSADTARAAWLHVAEVGGDSVAISPNRCHKSHDCYHSCGNSEPESVCL